MSNIKREGFGLSNRKTKHDPKLPLYLIDKMRKDSKKKIKAFRHNRSRQIFMKRHYDQVPDDNRVLDNRQNEDFQGGIHE